MEPSTNLIDENDPLLDTGEASLVLRVKPVSLHRWRTKGTGPRFRKFGRKVYYLRSDLLAYIAGAAASSTTEARRMDAERRRAAGTHLREVSNGMNRQDP